jgi:hypothetical protein
MSTDNVTLVFLAHPFANDPVRNVERVVRIARLIVRLSLDKALPKVCAPVVPHLALSVYDEDQNGLVRPITEIVSQRIVSACDELWLVSPQTSAGMRLEMEAARVAGIPVLGWADVVRLVPQLSASSTV